MALESREYLIGDGVEYNMFEEQYGYVLDGDVDALKGFIDSGALQAYNLQLMTDLQIARNMLVFNIAHCHSIALLREVPFSMIYPLLRMYVAISEDATSVQEISDAIVDAMLRFARIVRTHLNKMMSHQILQAKEYIDSHVYEQIRVADIADSCLLSVSGLEHRFKEEVGHSVTVAIQRAKIKKACQLLRDTDLSCAEIAYKLGFCTQSYFNKRFKAVMRITPLTYRKSVTNPVMFAARGGRKAGQKAQR